MSISTKTGDDGTTGLLFNRRVPKDHPRVEAYGSCDELNAALGTAKASLNRESSTQNNIAKNLHDIQETLVVLMGELASLPEDRERYAKAGHRFITAADVEKVTSWVHELESQKIRFDGWATPGATLAGAALDVARTTCRRAERRIFSLGKGIQDLNPEVIRYLNRVSDLLWLMARKIENETSRS